MYIVNSTVSGNRANIHGGGISNVGGTMSLHNATVTNNQADANFDGTGVGVVFITPVIFSSIATRSLPETGTRFSKST